MRGHSRARAPLSAARAFLAGAAILAGAATSAFPARAQATRAQDTRAQDGGDDTAMAIPRLQIGGDGAALPRPLDALTAARLRRAFQDASAPLDGLQDHPLLGHVLADRLTSPTARPALNELRAWYLV